MLRVSADVVTNAGRYSGVPAIAPPSPLAIRGQIASPSSEPQVPRRRGAGPINTFACKSG